MRIDANVADDDTPLAALMPETAATIGHDSCRVTARPDRASRVAVLAQDAAAYTGYSEQQFSDFVKRGVAPKSVLFSRNARRFKRSDLDAWCAAGGPSAYSSKGDPGAVRR